MTLNAKLIGQEKLAQAGEAMIQSRRKMADDLFKACQKYSFEVVMRSQRDYLAGPRPDKLGHVSGNLSGSMAQRVDRDEDGFTIVVGNRMKYAPVHEIGNDGEPTVVQITPQMKKFFWFKFFQKKDPKYKAMALSKRSNFFIFPRPFIRPAIEDAKPHLESDIAHILAMYRVEGVGDGK